MFCRKCGASISDDSNFCPICGVNVERVNKIKPVSETSSDHRKIQNGGVVFWTIIGIVCFLLSLIAFLFWGNPVAIVIVSILLVFLSFISLSMKCKLRAFPIMTYILVVLNLSIVFIVVISNQKYKTPYANLKVSSLYSEPSVSNTVLEDGIKFCRSAQHLRIEKWEKAGWIVLDTMYNKSWSNRKVSKDNKKNSVKNFAETKNYSYSQVNDLVLGFDDGVLIRYYDESDNTYGLIYENFEEKEGVFYRILIQVPSVPLFRLKILNFVRFYTKIK